MPALAAASVICASRPAAAAAVRSRAAAACRAELLVPRGWGYETVRPVTRAPTDFASATPYSTVLPESSDPSVGIRIWVCIDSLDQRPADPSPSFLAPGILAPRF